MVRPENIQGGADDEFARTELATPIDIEFLLRDYLIIILTFDGDLRLEFSTGALESGRAAVTPYPVGADFCEIFGGEPGDGELAGLAAAAAAGSCVHAEMSLKAPDGPVTLRMAFTPRLTDGRPNGLVVVIENITRRHAEMARASALEDRLRAILDNVADGIVVIDTAGRIEGLNRAAAKIAGRTIDQLTGARISELMSEPYRSAHQSHIQRYLDNGQSGILNVGPRRLPLQRGDNRIVPIELSVGEAWIGGRRKFIGVIRDLTQSLRQEEALIDANAELKARIAALELAGEDLEAQKLSFERLAAATQKARETAEQANRAKSRFVATVSHELRTPLNGILAVADLLTRRNLSDEAREMAEIISRSGGALLALLNDILDMAKVEAGALQIHVRPFAPAAVLRGVADIWQMAAQAKGVRLEIATDDLPGAVRGDPDRLRQILSNLINNALKFTDGDRVGLRATGAAVSASACRIRFMVTDDGPGIAPGLRERMFEPFVQAENGDARRHPGSGLGLAICRELVALMGGRIWIEGHGESGTAVILEIDFPLAEAEEPSDPVQTGTLAGPIPAGLTLLVAEDHPANRRVMSLILDEVGWRYEFAVNGREAVALAASGRFDAVLMDLQMPEMDGLAATRAIRNLPGPVAAIPVIGVTASASLQDMAQAREAGMEAVAAKPIDPARLIATVARCLGQISDNTTSHGET
jgi:PAS domain S-box-containing protein